MRIDPWASTQYADYAKLRDEFGIETFNPTMLPEPHKLMRRGVIFGHRGFERIAECIKGKKRFSIMTGLMPSGNMHFGHKMVIDQVIYYQKNGADISIAIADIEAMATRNVSLSAAKNIALDQYVTSYIALGLRPENCNIYFQSKRTAVKDLAYILGKKINFSEMRAIYGFEDSTNMSHVFAPLVQVGDILHVQLHNYGGPRPTLVPVGVDQDPHMRLTRGLASDHRLYSVMPAKEGGIGIFVKTDDRISELLDEAEGALKGLGYTNLKKVQSYKALYAPKATSNDISKIEDALVPAELKFGGYGFYQPSSTYHRFMTGLTGDKMSSSKPETAIFLTDEPRLAAKKIKSAKTGGAVSVDEQRKHGGKPEECAVYEMFLYHFIEDDSELNEIYQQCKNGKLLCGECKNRAAKLIEEYLKEFQKKRVEAKSVISKYLRND
ncbi:MAG: tryptophan--tRNA ligase [Thermoplasmata archaeon]